ncbi:MAG: Nif3-like dinuclear metal center hexameric protein [Calditrichaeota bacterium]|nr:Nif3-like dinuclear metal center hexameric protein [Calditrichota bacterium]
MIERDKIVNWLDEFLNAYSISEYCPNGMQVQGKEQIKKVVVGVSASLEFIEKAIDAQADMIIVHHGIIWKGEWNRINGVYREKVKRCLDSGLNLLAYHLPLDGHLEVGNAVALSQFFNLSDIRSFAEYSGMPIGISGKYSGSKADFYRIVKDRINKDALILDFAEEIRDVAIVTGGAQGEFRSAIDSHYDAYLTGEASEWAYHMAKEEKRTFIAAGHHATERYGVQLLAKRLAETFTLETEFIDCYNPI